MSATALTFDYEAESLTVTPCPVCGAHNPSIPTRDRYGFAIGTSTCACGLGYLNPRLSAEGYARFYQGPYRALTTAFCGGRSHDDAEARRAAIRRAHVHAAAIAQRHLGPFTRLLDVGGGMGLMARTLAADLGIPSVTVLDPSADDVRVAVADGCYGIEGCVETLPPSADTYDLIVCLQTSDHWRDPLGALRWLRQACAPGGHLWIDIVDMDAFQQTFTRACRWKVDHPLAWTPKAFERALTDTGWRVCDVVAQPRRQAPCGYRPVFWCEGV